MQNDALNSTLVRRNNDLFVDNVKSQKHEKLDYNYVVGNLIKAKREPISNIVVLICRISKYETKLYLYQCLHLEKIKRIIRLSAKLQALIR